MPLLLLVAGGFVGGLIGGTHGGIWGSIIGFASGCGVLLGLLWARSGSSPVECLRDYPASAEGE